MKESSFAHILFATGVPGKPRPWAVRFINQAPTITTHSLVGEGRGEGDHVRFIFQSFYEPCQEAGGIFHIFGKAFSYFREIVSVSSLYLKANPDEKLRTINRLHELTPFGRKIACAYNISQGGSEIFT